MEKVQWFPGHMHKAAREMRDALSGVDVVLELLDARLPCSSANPMLSELSVGRRVVRLLMKSDLADPILTESWLSWYRENRPGDTRAFCTGSPDQAGQLVQLCRAGISGRRGAIVAMVVGIPNVGKSTLINRLAGRSVARTGNEPAVTRHQQRVAISHDVVLLDTPGVLWPNLENPHGGYRLAATGAIRETALSHHEVALYLAGFLASEYPSRMMDRYGTGGCGSDPEGTLRAIGRMRGCLVAGGAVDLERAARVLINDFRSGALGRMTLETPTMMEAEWRAVEQAREEKARRKVERKARRKGH